MLKHVFKIDLDRQKLNQFIRNNNQYMLLKYFQKFITTV